MVTGRGKGRERQRLLQLPPVWAAAALRPVPGGIPHAPVRHHSAGRRRGRRARILPLPGLRRVLLSAKARSEFIVVPILLACQEMSAGAITIYSGQRLDVDPERGLVGECDFILSAAPPVPALRAPLVTIVEAKRNEVESGVWQCIAQMVGAREFNQRSGGGPEAIYGCVTNAEAWQFLRLSGSVAGI